MKEGDKDTDEAPKTNRLWLCGRDNLKIKILMLSLYSPMHQVAVLPILQKEEWFNDIAGIILSFDTFGSHLETANKTIDINLKSKF